MASSRRPYSASEGIVFLAVPDAAVPGVLRELAQASRGPDVAFAHVSGALRLDALAPLASGHPVGSFHPLQAFPAPRPPAAFAGITIAVDATEPELERRLARLGRRLGARPRHVGDQERALYHAAAVFASNYAVVVVAEAIEILRRAGWPRDEARRALLPLVEGAVANLKRKAPPAALSGPIRRGDASTVERHRAALQELPSTEELYRMLGLVALGIAQEAGLEPAAAGRTRRALTRSRAATRRRRS